MDDMEDVNENNEEESLESLSKRYQEVVEQWKNLAKEKRQLQRRMAAATLRERKMKDSPLCDRPIKTKVPRISASDSTKIHSSSHLNASVFPTSGPILSVTPVSSPNATPVPTPSATSVPTPNATPPVTTIELTKANVVDQLLPNLLGTLLEKRKESKKVSDIYDSIPSSLFEWVVGIGKQLFEAILEDNIAKIECTNIETGEPKILSGAPRALSPRDQLLLFLIWARHYPSEALLAWVFKVNSSCTISKYLSRTLDIMEGYFAPQICIPPREIRNEHSIQYTDGLISAVVDGTYQQVFKSSDRIVQKNDYSQHRGLHVFTRLLLCAPDGIIYWISKPHPGSVNDKSLMGFFETREVWDKFDDDEWVLGDVGFEGMHQYHEASLVSWKKKKNKEKIPFTLMEQLVIRKTASLRIVVENVFAQIKKWNSCSCLWRHSTKKNAQIWIVVPALVSKQLRKLQK